MWAAYCPGMIVTPARASFAILHSSYVLYVVIVEALGTQLAAIAGLGPDVNPGEVVRLGIPSSLSITYGSELVGVAIRAPANWRDQGPGRVHFFPSLGGVWVHDRAKCASNELTMKLN
jgi:hypothetical protein